MTSTWPKGVIARYLTVGGATVDLTDWPTAKCGGCGAWHELPDLEARKRWAQGHAEKCRAIPAPGGE